VTELAALVGDEDAEGREMALAYFGRRFAADGWEWIERQLKTYPEMTPKAQAQVLLSTRDTPKSWERADEKGQEVAHEYWALFVPYGLGSLEGVSIEYIARRMMAVERFAASLDFLAMYSYHPDKLGDTDKIALVIADGLEGLLSEQDKDPELLQLAQYDFAALFTFLEKNKEAIGEDRVGALEWSYLPVLGHEPAVPSLHAKMSRDPAFFVQMVSNVYLPHNRDAKGREKASAEKMRLAENAYHLLSSWSVPPGMELDGILNGEMLESWVKEALVLLEKADRLEVGQSHIGQVLASSPADPDGSWPPKVVRNLLESLESEEIDDGFRVQVINGRGVTTRSPGEGGAQEFELAAGYRERTEKFRGKWSRTATIMRRLADSYDRDGRVQESEAERFRQGLDR